MYNIGGGYHVAAINNLTGYGNAHLCTYNMDLRTIDDLKARLPQNDNIAKVKNNNINTCKIMEKRMITKPFDLELAKKISDGECNGEIVTVGDNYKVKLVYYNKDRIEFSTLGVICSDYGITSDWFSDDGIGTRGCRLCINIPEYTTFKDGDVLSNEEGDYLFILNTNGKYLTSHYASWKKGSYLHLNNGHADQNNIERYRFATEDERQKFIDALKISKEPKAKICLKQFFGIEIEPKYKFKPFDKVLVRDTEDDDWHVSLFVRKIADAQYKEERYECLNGTGWIYCIPYEGNEHLL
nr:MAG TPA: hypothetical protein [Caudoviricetes sp.]